MRFHIGFSKRVSLKWFLALVGVLIALFGLTLTPVHAESLIPQYYSDCPFGITGYNNSSCTQLSSSVLSTESLNGMSNVLVPNGFYNNSNYTGYSRLNYKKTTIIKWTSTDCPSTNQTLSYYVDVIMGDYDNSFARNVLDPNNTAPNNPPIITSMYHALRNVLASSTPCTSTWCYYWPWLSNTSSNSDNQTGVQTLRANGTGLSNCIFISINNTSRSVRYQCNFATQGGGSGHSLIINQYNNNYSKSQAMTYNSIGLSSKPGYKITKINDPCVSIDNSGVINSINQGVIDIIDNNNTHNDEINGKLDDIIDNQESIIDNMTNQNGSTNSNGLGQWLNGHNSDVSNGVFSTILQAPLRLYQAIEDADVDSCEGISLPISFGGASKTAVIPCGKQFWQAWPTNAVLIYHTIVFGGLAFGILMYLVKSFNGFLDPKDMSEIETSKL